MKFIINTTPDKYFRQLLELLRPFAPFNQMRDRELDVFAEILYHDYLHLDKNKDARERIVFGYETKQEIADKLGISKGNLYNIYKELRKRKLLKKESIPEKVRLSDPNKIKELIFVLNISSSQDGDSKQDNPGREQRKTNLQSDA